MFINVNKKNYFCNLITAFILIFCSVGCSKHGDGGASQVVAKVDGVDISVHQLNQYLSKVPNVTAENAEKTKAEILNKLIEQQVIVNRALKDNLDRSPEFVMALESAKKELLTRYYLSKLAATSTKVADTEVKSFYDAHPELFANRNIYSFQVLEIGSTVDNSVKEMIGSQKSLSEIAAYLRVKGFNFSEGNYVKPAEQMPMEVLSKLQNVKEGEVIMFDGGHRTTIIQMYKTEKSPLDFGKASALIKTYISNTNSKKIIAESLVEMKKNSKVEYIGEFAKLNQTSDLGNANQTEPKSSISDSNANSNPSVDKGLSGLK